MHLIGRRSPVNRATIDKYTEEIAVEGQRIQNELGFVPQYDLAAGWRETVRGKDVERRAWSVGRVRRADDRRQTTDCGQIQDCRP